jgi:hypothetical protein
VKGVWENDAKPRFDKPGFTDLTFDELVDVKRDGTRVAHTSVKGPDGVELGTVWRELRPDGTLELKEIFVERLPSKVQPATGTWMTPTGTPTSVFITMRQMKALGVGYGQLKKVKMSTIQNIPSIIQLQRLIQTEGLSLDQAVRRTHSIEYAESTFVQSGHRIAGVKLKKGPDFNRTTLQVLLDHYETRGGRLKEGDPAIVRKHDAMLDEFGKGSVTRDTVVNWNYDIEIELMPFHGKEAK